MSDRTQHESDPDAIPEFDTPRLRPTRLELDHAIFVLNDWTGGQYQSISDPTYFSSGYYEMLQHITRIVDMFGQDKLDENGKEVLYNLKNMLPTLLKRSLQIEEESGNSFPHLTDFTSGRNSPGFVYLLQSPTRAYKIGRTSNPKSRLKTFGIQLPFEVEYICLIKTDDMYGLENALHSYFQDKRINGEWFALLPEDVENIKGLAK